MSVTTTFALTALAISEPPGANMFLETLTKRRSNSDALTAANMTLYIRGPSPSVPGVCILFYSSTQRDSFSLW